MKSSKGRPSATRLVAPPSAKLGTGKVVGDRLFSKTSLRYITAANTRETELLTRRYLYIDSAARTVSAGLEHQKNKVQRKCDWLKSKLEDKPWRRLLSNKRRSQSEPPPGGAYSHPDENLVPFPRIHVEEDGDDVLDPSDWGSRVRTLGVPASSGARGQGGWILGAAPDGARRDSTGPSGTITMEDIGRLARRIYTPTAGEPDAVLQRERRLANFLLQTIGEMDGAPRPGAGARPSQLHVGDVVRRMVTSLSVENSLRGDRSSASSDFGDDKRRRYLEAMSVSALRLPPLYKTKSNQLRARDWNEGGGRPREAAAKLSVRDWSELQCCRYLRQKVTPETYDRNP